MEGACGGGQCGFSNTVVLKTKDPFSRPTKRGGERVTASVVEDPAVSFGRSMGDHSTGMDHWGNHLQQHHDALRRQHLARGGAGGAGSAAVGHPVDSVEDFGGGTYGITFTARLSGYLALDIRVDGLPVRGRPVSVGFFSSGPLHGPSCRVAFPAAAEGGPLCSAGKP
jgi:hypothetical protein